MYKSLIIIDKIIHDIVIYNIKYLQNQNIKFIIQLNKIIKKIIFIRSD